MGFYRECANKMGVPTSASTNLSPRKTLSLFFLVKGKFQILPTHLNIVVFDNLFLSPLEERQKKKRKTSFELL